MIVMPTTGILLRMTLMLTRRLSFRSAKLERGVGLHVMRMMIVVRAERILLDRGRGADGGDWGEVGGRVR